MRKRKPEELKVSGIEWIGKIPVHWNSVKLRWIGKIHNGATPKSDVAKYWNGEINWATPEDLSARNKFLKKSKRNISVDGLNNCGATLVPKGSILLSTRAPIGYTTIVNDNFTTNQGCKSIIINSDVAYNECVYYSIVAAEKVLQSLGSGSTFTELSTSELSDFQISLPPKPEQKAIATFLDRKTQAIDQLIEKKQQLIEKLKEKRQALITQAVTKGLNPGAPMKDSGIEWLGEIPEHWELVKFKHSVRLINHKSENAEFIVALENLESWTGKYFETDSEYNPSGISFRPNDVLFGKLRPYLAKAYLAEKHGNAVGDFYVFRGRKYLPGYLLMIVLSEVFIDVVDSSTYGAKMPRASWDFIGDLKLPTPSIDEQQLIIEQVNAHLDSAIKLKIRVDEQIEKLKEYRQSLISAAVTGKIDVRDEVKETVIQEAL